MSAFENCIGFVLRHEGGFGNHPNDPGGPTNFGISLRYVLQNPELMDHFDVDQDGDVDIDDIKNMTREAAVECYRRQWWNRYQYGRIHDDGIAMRVFSLSVNMGPLMAHRIVQRTCRAVGRETYLRDGYKVRVAEDGMLGPITFDAVKGANVYAFLCAFRSEAAGHYRLLTERNPKFISFIGSWLNRAYY